MTERHAIAGAARGEARPPGCVGACVRLPLDAPPTLRWSEILAARLATRLTGRASVGHLRLDHVVQGTEIVLDGVERDEADHLGPVLREAIAAANRACVTSDPADRPRNMDPEEAEGLARRVEAGVRGHD